jgi:rhodanese-related sulfurtransferase
MTRAAEPIDPETVQEMLNRGEAVLIDVRDAGPFTEAHPHGATNVPIDQLADRAAELPDDVTVVVSCGGGTRGGRGATILNDLGIEAKTMATGLRGWRAAGLPVDGTTAE